MKSRVSELLAVVALLTVPLALGLLLYAPSAAVAAGEHAGQTVFMAQKCTMCHSVQSQQVAQTSKMAGSDLSTVGAKRDAAWLTQYLKKEVAGAEGKKHGKEWKGTPAELEQLTKWLASLK